MQKILSRLVRFLQQAAPWTLFLFICAHLLKIYIDHYPTIPTKSLLMEILWVYSIGTAITIGSYLFFRDWSKSVAIALLFTLFEFYFSLAHSLIKSTLGSSFWTSYSFVLPAGVLLLLTCCRQVTKRPRKKLLQLSNYYSIALLSYTAISFFVNSTGQRQLRKAGDFKSMNRKPSIVLIVLDEYAGNASLRSHFNFDNSEFSSKMKAMRFQEIENPRSLYNSTIFSMASFFSMEKLILSSHKVSDIKNRKAAIQKINNNPFVDRLQSNGYTIHNHSIFPFNDQPPPGDFYKLHIVGADLLRHYNTSHTIYRDLSYHLYTRDFFGFNLSRLQKKYVAGMNNFLNETRSIVQATAETGNFHYIHFMMPHTPFLYKSDGTMQSAASLLNETSESLYLEYLKYCNHRFIEWLSDATQGKEDTIFIVMSDHGWKSMSQPSPDKIEFNTILYVRGLKKEIPDSVMVPNILPHVLEELCDTTLKKMTGASIYLYD